MSGDFGWGWIAEADRVVQSYETAARSKLARMQPIQVAFAVAVLFLFAIGYLLVERSVVRPMARLQQAAGRIAGGGFHKPALTSRRASSVIPAGASGRHLCRHECWVEVGRFDRRVRRWYKC